MTPPPIDDKSQRRYLCLLKQESLLKLVEQHKKKVVIERAALADALMRAGVRVEDLCFQQLNSICQYYLGVEPDGIHTRGAALERLRNAAAQGVEPRKNRRPVVVPDYRLGERGLMVS